MRDLNSGMKTLYPKSKMYYFFRYMDDTTLYIGIAFSVIGFLLGAYGHQKESARIQAISFILIFFGYFISVPWIAIAVGCTLILFAFWPSSR